VLWPDAALGACCPLSLHDALPMSTAARDQAPDNPIFAAEANLSGAVYYWEVNNGDILRIDEGATSPTRIFPDNNGSGTCRGCHRSEEHTSELQSRDKLVCRLLLQK